MRLSAALASLPELLAYYAIPIAIAVVSLIALSVWDDRYHARDDRPLGMQALPETEQPLQPAQALARLAARPLVTSHETRLSEAPVWFTFQVPAGAGPQAVEFPSRHIVDIACWDAAALRPLGHATRAHAEGGIRFAKAGYAILDAPQPARLLCRAAPVGPARLAVTLWSGDALQTSIHQYHRKSGLLDGGLIVLAVFVLLTALINRQRLYVLFAAWLVLNLRVAAISAGWDMQWLGQSVPEHWLLPLRTVTISLNALATVTLYRELFREELRHSRFALPLKIGQWACVALLAAALALPYAAFLQVMWAMTALGVLVTSCSLASIALHTRTRVALWYAASLGVTCLSSMSEIAAAALGMRELVGIANSVTAALASSLLTALAIAEDMRQEHVRRLADQAQFEHTYEAMPVGLFTLDATGRFISGNPALQAMLGSDLSQAGAACWKWHFADGAWTQLHQMLDARNDAELEIASADGNRRFLVKAALAHGKIEGFLQDITDKARATEDLRFLANHDPLTKIYNRRGIGKVFDNARRQQQKDKPLALAYLDLDRFKLINDLFGHAAGDEVLQQVCQRISTMLAHGQCVGRIGGDEFVIVMPDTTVQLASLICLGIVNSIGNTPYRVGDKAFHVRCSIGLVEVGPGMGWQEAVSTADRACREAKSGHGNGFAVYEKDATALHERKAELNLISHLSLADATAGLFIEMQPIMSLKAPHDSLNVEVLLRMRADDGTVIPAGRIIGAAEKSGRTGVIDRWVLGTVLAWLDAHAKRLERTQFVCLNLSGASLNDEHFIEDSIDLLQEHASAARRLCIEITESVALHDMENTRRFINAVRGYGVRIGLDDFGAGYTSFSYLKQLPADVLKIDGSFIVNINEHRANVAIVEAIVNLATNLGMKTIAEWAEDTATVQTLAKIGVDYVQGFAIARSRAPEDILAADSSASFIVDDELRRLVNALAKVHAASRQRELSEVIRLRGVHCSRVMPAGKQL